MTTYTAAVGTAANVVAGEFCDVEVITEDQEGRPTYEVILKAETAVRTDHEDVLGVVGADAERVLAEHGWRVTGEWDIADNALYAPVERAEP